MKLHALLLTPVLVLSSQAQDTASPPELIVAAIGQIPVARMKMGAIGAVRGYVEDETSTNQWFPQDWTVDGQAVKLGLNIEPLVVKMPTGKEPFNLATEGAPPKPQTLPTTAEQETTLMLIFNREAQKPWKVGFESMFVGCKKLDPAAPTAVVMNLSGVVVSIATRDYTIHEIAPGKSDVAAVFVNPQGEHKLIPLATEAGGNTYSLDVATVDTRAPWCPVVVIYPNNGPSKKTRPLQVSVIQPSDAIRGDQPKASSEK